MKNHGEFVVRQAMEGDVQALVELEQKVYGPLGTGYFGEEHIRCWLEVFPEGLIVAEHEEKVVAYIYSQGSDSSLFQQGKILGWDELTDDGYTRKTHLQDGDALFGLSALSIMHGGFIAVIDKSYEVARKLGKKFVYGFARLPGFNKYCLELEKNFEVDEDVAVLCYAVGTALLAGGNIDPGLERTCLESGYPLPDVPDKVMARHMTFPGLTLAGIASNFAKDPEGRDFAAILYNVILES